MGDVVLEKADLVTSRPFSLWREDMITALCATSLMIGLFIDGWNHINLQNGALGSFFTLWHGVLYAGFTATATWVMTRNPHIYLARTHDAKPEMHRVAGVPLRYPFALVGIAVATVGLMGDAIWHTALGEEEGVARVISPFHLLLFAGACLLIAAPFRSGWYAPNVYPATASFRQILPPLLSLTLVAALAAFMFQWLSAFLDWTPSLQIDRVPDAIAGSERVQGTVEFAGVARVLVTNVILMMPVFLALRRWRLPPGSVTFLFTTVAVAMAALTEFRLGATIFAALLGGIAADVAIQRLQPSPIRPLAYRVIAAVVPMATWSAYFVILWIAYDITWPFDLWLGTVGLAALTSVVLSTVAIPPSMPGSVWSDDQGHALSIATNPLSGGDLDPPARH